MFSVCLRYEQKQTLLGFSPIPDEPSLPRGSRFLLCARSVRGVLLYLASSCDLWQGIEFWFVVLGFFSQVWLNLLKCAEKRTFQATVWFGFRFNKDVQSQPWLEGNSSGFKPFFWLRMSCNPCARSRMETKMINSHLQKYFLRGKRVSA